MALAALIGGGTGLAALLRTRGQNLKDRADSNQSNAAAIASLTDTIAELSERMTAQREANEKAMDELRAQLNADIEAKDIRLKVSETAIKRLESDVILLKQKLGEWRAYAMGLYDMLIKLRQTPPPPPDTGPLK